MVGIEPTTYGLRNRVCYSGLNASLTLNGALSQWVMLSLGRKPRTQDFNKEIAEIIRKHWPGTLDDPVAGFVTDQVIQFAQRVAHYCPSRWNTIVSALQFITPAARRLKRRPPRSKERPASLDSICERGSRDARQIARDHWWRRTGASAVGLQAVAQLGLQSGWPAAALAP